MAARSTSKAFRVLPDIQYDGLVKVSRAKDKCNDDIHIVNSLVRDFRLSKAEKRDADFLKSLHAYIGAEIDFLNEEHANGDDPKEYEVAFVQKLVTLEIEIFKKIYR
jgi:hypothetical protein